MKRKKKWMAPLKLENNTQSILDNMYDSRLSSSSLKYSYNANAAFREHP